MTNIWLLLRKVVNKLRFLFDPSYKKVICKYQIIEGKKGIGTMHFCGLKKEFTSGPYGNGFAPKGKYKAKKITLLDKTFDKFNSYAQHDFGWFMPIVPQFETDRSGLGCHPDGNVEGSQGCIVFNFVDIDENVKMYNLFNNYFKENSFLEVEIS